MSAPHMKLEAAAAASGVDTVGQDGPRVKRLKGLQPLQYGSGQLSAQLTGRKQQQEKKHTQQSAAENLVLESSSTGPQDQDSSAADVIAAASAAGGACRGVQHTKGSSSRLQHTTAAGQAASSHPRRALQAPAHGACDEAFYSPGHSPTHASTAGCTSSSAAAAAAGTGAATVAEGAGESAMAVGQTSAPVQAGRLSMAAAAAAGVGTSELADGADIAAVAMTAAANAAAAAASAAKCAEFALASRLDKQRRPSLQQQTLNEPQHLLQGQMHLCEQQQQQQQQMLDVVQQEQQMDWPTNNSPLQAPGFTIEQQQQQQHQQGPPVDLNEQYKVWPDLDSRTDGSTETEFDLVPLSACSAGVQPMLQMLVNATQKPEPKVKSEPSSGRGRGGKGRGRGAGRSTSKGRGRGRPKKHVDSDATAAAASRLAGKIRAAAAAGGGSSSMFDSWESGGTDPDVPPYCDYSYAQEDDWQYGQQQYDDLYGQYDELQYGEQHDFNAFGFDGSSSAAATAAAAAAAGSVDDEDAWYSAAEAAGTTFSWREAPKGRFYTVEYEKSKGAKTTSSGIEAVMTPAKVVTRRSFRDELWNMSKRTRVVPVTDPCHPCIHNPVRPAIMPIGRQLKLEANRDLPAGCLLGLYWGKVLTMQEDQLQNSLDLTCSYGLQHAYNMTAHSITAADLIGPDSLRLEVMVVGDSQRCRLCLVNDVSSWAQDMREQGWGPCPQEAGGSCNCEDYKIDTEELKAASINVKWRHFMYRALNGDYIPAIAAYTSKEVAEGRELLTTYEENNNGFFDAMTTNIRQHCYVQTLAAKSEAPVHALEKILSLICGGQPGGSNGSSSSSSTLQQIKQLAASGLESAQQQERNLSMLLSEARAMQMGEQVPAEVAEARRRAVAAYLQQQQQQQQQQ